MFVVRRKDISDINVIKSICLDLKIKFDEIEKLAYSEKVKSIYNSNSEKPLKIMYLEHRLLF